MAAPSGFSAEDKVVVVTGGGSGIGEAMCMHFSATGASKVVVVDMNFEAAQRVSLRQIQKHTRTVCRWPRR